MLWLICLTKIDCYAITLLPISPFPFNLPSRVFPCSPSTFSSSSNSSSSFSSSSSFFFFFLFFSASSSFSFLSFFRFFYSSSLLWFLSILYCVLFFIRHFLVHMHVDLKKKENTTCCFCDKNAVIKCARYSH